MLLLIQIKERGKLYRLPDLHYTPLKNISPVIFTIHFATINTAATSSTAFSAPEFTIHFATINTMQYEIAKNFYVIFTIHFATINTNRRFLTARSEKYLQYTLLLLIRKLLNKMKIF